VEPQTGNVGSSILDKDAWLLAGLPDTKVAGARDSSWSLLCIIWLCLAAKPFDMGVDVDGLACFLHHPTVYD
jgi:hypothetical protein